MMKKDPILTIKQAKSMIVPKAVSISLNRATNPVDKAAVARATKNNSPIEPQRLSLMAETIFINGQCQLD